MKRFIIIVVILALAGCGYYFFYPPLVLQRQTEKAFSDFSKMLALHDRAKVGEGLQKILSSTAQIHLEVRTISLSQLDGGAPVVQDFDKPAFITFIDNILFTLTEYYYEPEVVDFVLAADKKSAAVTFTSREWGDGITYYGGTGINTRFSSNSTCEGQVHFEGKNTLLDKASCTLRMTSVPKPEEAQKVQENPEALRQLLR